jgi:Protein of unknown function (DUF3276)
MSANVLSRPTAATPPAQKTPPRVLFRRDFKSVGPRSYGAEVKEASNGNHFLVLSETKPAKDTGEMRQHSIFIFSEDFDAYWNLLRDAARFIKDNPMPEAKRRERQAFWKDKPRQPQAAAARPAPRTDARNRATR